MTMGFALIAIAASAQQTQSTSPTPPASGSTDVSSSPPSTASADITTLDPFTVAAESTNGYQAENTLGGTKMNTPVKDLPFTLNIITSEFLKDTGTQDLGDALAFVAGVNISDSASPSTRDQTFSVRGLPSNFFMMDGIATYRTPAWEQVDSIEIIRGASAIAYGESQPGGVINITTRKADPTKEFGSVTQQVGEWGNFESRFDYNTPIGTDQKLALRISGSFDDQGSRRQGTHINGYTADASVVYKPNDRTTITVQYGKDDTKNRGVFAGMPYSFAGTVTGYGPLDANYLSWYNAQTPAQQQVTIAKGDDPSHVTPDAVIGGPGAVWLKDPYSSNVSQDNGTWNSDTVDISAGLRESLVKGGKGALTDSELKVSISWVDDRAQALIPLLGEQGTRGSDTSWATFDATNLNPPSWTGATWAAGGGSYTPNVGYFLNYASGPTFNNLAGSNFFTPSDITLPSALNTIPLAGPDSYYYSLMAYVLRNTNQINTVDWTNNIDFGRVAKLRLLLSEEYGVQKYYDAGPNQKTTDDGLNPAPYPSAWSATTWGPSYVDLTYGSAPNFGYGFTNNVRGPNGSLLSVGTMNPGTIWGAGTQRAFGGYYIYNADTRQTRAAHVTGPEVMANVLENYYGLTQDIKYWSSTATAQLQFFNDTIEILGAVRDENVSKQDYRQSPTPSKYNPVSPQVGLIYNITPSINIYASYADNFWYEWSRAANQLNQAAPVNEGKSVEVGSKFSFLGGRLSGTLSFATTKELGVSYSDPSVDLTTINPSEYPKQQVTNPSTGTPIVGPNGQPELFDQYGLTVFNGIAKSNTIEFSANYAPTRDDNLIFSYSYTKVTVVRAEPWMTGETLSGVPPHMASIWNKYTFNHVSGPLKGLDVGIGAIYHDAAQIGDGFGQGVFQESPSVWRAPVFIRYDAMLGYPFKWGTKTLRAQVNVKNLANRLNWTTDANFVPDGNGREVIGSLTLSF